MVGATRSKQLMKYNIKQAKKYIKKDNHVPECLLCNSANHCQVPMHDR